MVHFLSRDWPDRFPCFLIASVAETNRIPFDIPEAESELVSGYHTEYSGMKFAFFFLAEYVYVFLSSALLVTLFLGGADGAHFLPSWIWFLIKTSAMVFLFLWFRWTFPRLRVGSPDAVLLAVSPAFGAGQYRLGGGVDRLEERMTPELLIFYTLSALLIVFAVMVVTSRNLFRGAISLTAALGVMAGLFALLGADFLAAGQLLIYVGGVMVLLIFVVMFVQRPDIFRAHQTGKRWMPALVLGIGVIAILIHAFSSRTGRRWRGL